MKKIIITLVVLLLFWITQFSSNSKYTALEYTDIPNDYQHDGCTLFPDGNYLTCCIQHDETYFFGWSWQERLKADNDFAQCIIDQWKWYNYLLASPMWVWVRIWWTPIAPTYFRWWFGRDGYERFKIK